MPSSSSSSSSSLSACSLSEPIAPSSSGVYAIHKTSTSATQRRSWKRTVGLALRLTSLLDGICTSPSSFTWSNFPSKNSSAACMTSLHCLSAACAWAGVAPLKHTCYKIVGSLYSDISYHFHKLLDFIIHLQEGCVSWQLEGVLSRHAWLHKAFLIATVILNRTSPSVNTGVYRKCR